MTLVADARTEDGEEITLWRPAGDQELLSRRSGMTVQVAKDSRGKINLVESGSVATLDQPLPTAPVPVKSIAPTIPDTEPEMIEGFLYS